MPVPPKPPGNAVLGDFSGIPGGFLEFCGKLNAAGRVPPRRTPGKIAVGNFPTGIPTVYPTSLDMGTACPANRRQFAPMGEAPVGWESQVCW